MNTKINITSQKRSIVSLVVSQMSNIITGIGLFLLSTGNVQQQNAQAQVMLIFICHNSSQSQIHQFLTEKIVE